MHRVVRGGRRHAPAMAVLCALAWPGAAGIARAEMIRIYAFNLAPNSAYQIQLSTNLGRVQATSLDGSLVVDVVAPPGTRLSVAPDSDTQPPPPPILVSADIMTDNCVRTVWLPSSDPTVVGYVVSFGTASVAAGHAAGYDGSVEVTGATAHDICSLGRTTYYFAVQARNHLGQLSAYSAERSVTVSTVPVLFSSFAARADEDGVRLTWGIVADELVGGFRVYRREAGQPVQTIAPSLPGNAGAYLDSGVRAGTAYTYQLGALGEDGSETLSVPVNVTTPALALALGANAPNPFNANTRIPFTLDEASRVALRIYDVRGAHVATLLDMTLPQGRHEADWPGLDDVGRRVASGAYFCVLVAGNRRLSRKMLLVR